MAVYFADDFTSASARARRVNSGEIVPLTRGVWTDETTRSPSEVVGSNWRAIVGHAMPGAVITDRSAFVLRPVGGQLFVSHPSRRPLELPGLTVFPDGRVDNRRDDDVPLDAAGRVFGASRARALIDNAEKRGRPGSVRRRLTTDELHDQVANIVGSATPRQLDNMLADVEADANAAAARKIRSYVEAARGSGPLVATGSRAMAAAQSGEQYDHSRVALFTRVVADLQRQHFVQRFVNDLPRATLVPFYEAYFSNYIEGSTLTVREAERVVFKDDDVGKPADAHDIRSTWEVVSDFKEMSRAPRSANDFMDMLRERHSVMMAAHPNKRPGEWKNEEVSAGATLFVHPDHVVGTLRAGWEEGGALTDPFQRAAYMMFVISEVHPFLDGNGRSARVAMNGELVPHGMHRIIIPTVLRNEYVSGLVRTTAGNGPDGLYRVLDRAQQWVSVGEFADLETGDRYLRVTNATTDSGVAAVEGIHLRVLRAGELFELPDTEHHAPGQDVVEPSILDVAASAVDDSNG